MINPELTQAQVPLVRVVGVDGGKQTPQQLQYPQIMTVPDSATQSFKQAGANTIKGYEIAADTYGKLAQIRGQAVKTSTSAADIGRGLQGLGATLTDYAKLQAMQEENKRKEEEARLKAQQSSNFTEATVMANEFINQSLQKARDENPIQAKQDAISYILQSDISDDDKRTLINKTFTSFNDLYKDWDSNQLKTFERGQAAKVSNLEAELGLRVASLRADLKNPTISATRVTDILTQIDSEYDNAIANSNLDPILAMEMRGRVLANTLQNVELGQTARSAIEEKAAQYASASTEIAKILNEEFGGDATNPDFQYRAGLIATQNGLPSSFRVYTTQDQFKDRYEFERTKNAAEELTRSKILAEDKARNYTLYEYGERVFLALNDKAYEQRLDPRSSDAVVVGILEQWRKDKTKFSNLRQETFSLQTRLNAELNPKETASTSTSTSADAILGDAQQKTSVTQSKYFTPVDQAKVQSLQAEIELRNTEMLQLRQGWVQYGLDDFDNPGVSIKSARQRNAGSKAVVEEYKKQNPNRVAEGQGASAATAFGQRAPKLESYDGMLTPFKAGVAFQISRTHTGDPHGDGTGHQYAAIDFAVPANTPAYSLVPGRVIKADNTNPGGYGMEIIVAGADGRAVRYAHMNKATVKVGDLVAPGQLVGYTGGEPGHPNAGRTSGAHLHMDFPDAKDIYNKSGFAEPRTFLKGLPKQLQRPLPGYGLPPSQGMGASHNLSVISLGRGGYIKNGVYYAPNGGIHNLNSGETFRAVTPEKQKQYARINNSLGITPEKIQQFKYAPQYEALPSELSTVPGGTGIKLRKPVTTAFTRMAEAAAREGVSLDPVSGFRSVSEQAAILQDKIGRRGMSVEQALQYSAPPGHSEHHTGDALDIGTNVPGTELNESFETTGAFQWLKKNGNKFGFHLTYDKNSEGTGYEPWHWRYKGKGAAPGGGATSGTAPMSQSRPVSTGMAPINKSAYPKKNNPNANYGYGILKDNPGYARKLNEVSDRLGIPGQWLADVIDYENDTHNPSRYGGSGNHYVGLIQIGEAAASDMGTTRAALSTMSREQQLEYVYKYLKMRPGALNTIEDLYAKINIGNSLDSPDSRAGKADGNAGFPYHVKRIGMRAGRRYRTSYDSASAIHTSYTSGCALCNQLAQSGGKVPPHYAA